MFESYNEDVPKTMRALRLRAYEGVSALACEEVPVPALRDGQVLVRVLASPINPSDQMFVRGLYGFTRPLPTTPGFEGCGVVVASGGGMPARALLGRRVAVSAQREGDGLWAEYFLTHYKGCVPIKSHITDEQAASLLINPMTAYAMVERALATGHQAIVQTAAAGALGRMIARVAASRGLPVIHVVRRPEQVEALRALGARWIVSTAEADWKAQLKELAHEHKATVAFDAVAGPMVADLAACMPRRSRIWVYGALSEQPVTMTPGALIFDEARVEGFWLSAWMRDAGLVEIARAGMYVQDHFHALFDSPVQGTFGLEAVGDAFAAYASDMTRGKALIVPGAPARPL